MKQRYNHYVHRMVAEPRRWYSIGLLVALLFGTISLSAGSSLAPDQDTRVRGVVTDNTGETLIGVSVVVKGTSTGASTDIDGSYSVNVPDGSNVLVFSYTGYKTFEAEVNGRTTIDVVMEEDSELLNEVVVVGYGTIKKSNLTGSVASLDGSELTAIVTGNATTALQGKITGVQVENNGGEPGGAANVFVRGVSSLTNSFPLYVIDGTFADNMNNLNPKDIERIEVLKDASAAAIYGSRAANGVVIIQTKRGKEGGEPVVNFDLRAGVEAPTRLLDFLDGQQFEQYRNAVEMNDGTGRTFSSRGNSVDYQDLSLNSGSVEDYGISIGGGGQNSRYFISGNYYDQEGILVGSGFDRLNLRANTGFTFGRFDVQQSLGMSQSNIQRNNWFGFDGLTAPNLAESNPDNEGGFEAPIADRDGFGGVNKYAQALLEDNNERRRNLLGNVNIGFEVAEGLTARLNLGVDYTNAYVRSFTPTFFMSETDAVFNVNDLNDLTEVRTEFLQTQIEPTLNYGRDFNNTRIDAVVGYTEQKIDFSTAGAYVQGLPNNNIQVIGAATPSQVQAIEGRQTISGLRSVFGRINAAIDGKYLLSGTLRRDASSKFAPDFRVGYFPSVSVGWNISREDFWSVDNINNFKFRAGYGELGSQNIPDYSYQSVFNLNSNTSVNNVLQQGYAQTSLALEDLQWETAKTFNVGFDVGLFEDKITFSAEYYNKDVEDVLVGVALPSTIGFSNPVIQNVGSINNSGLEFEGIFRQRGSDNGFNWDFGVNFATFNSEVTELPNTVIGPAVTEDLVSVNRYIEGQAPGVYWGFVVDGIYDSFEEIDSDPNVKNDEARRGRINPDTGEFERGVLQPGDFRRIDQNGDGIINGDDQVVLGDPTPDFIYGMNFSGSHSSGFDFAVFFQGVYGNEIYNVNKYYNIFWQDDNKLVDVLDAWTPSNTDTDIPRATAADPATNGAPSSFFVEDGSYFRLRTLELGYTLGLDNVDWADNLRFFVTGQNLFTLTDYTGYNPDISSANGGRANRNDGFYGFRPDVNPLLARGVDQRAYPNARSFIFGIQAQF